MIRKSVSADTVVRVDNRPGSVFRSQGDRKVRPPIFCELQWRVIDLWCAEGIPPSDEGADALRQIRLQVEARVTQGERS
jgi:hypothetical protein